MDTLHTSMAGADGPHATMEKRCMTAAVQSSGVAVCAGAGKTYTMEGIPEAPGINYRTMKELFRCEFS